MNTRRTSATLQRLLHSLWALPLVAATAPSFAGAAKWSSTNMQYLYGTSYQNVYFDNAKGLTSRDETAAILTLEHVNGWAYGDTFFFVDVFNPDRKGEYSTTSYYGELSPRLSLSSLTGSDLSAGLIKDVLFTSTAELGNGLRNYLYGVAVDLNIPGTPVAQINYYLRNEMKASGNDLGQQLTFVWLTPFKLGSTEWAFEGFLDYAFGLEKSEDNIVSGPRLLMDVGKTFGAPGTLQAGIEYQLWRNKYGIKGIDEDAPQLMVKWIW